ncbi:MAG: class I SAM-dependent methyltransferase [Terracidiphilus sp.]|nr:class I SAM-dependent methyltransferase [Terracidiphilus sp.]MDR3797042.1 class I SAM-dependent methyltransferase [Terracidiphilus sp.]
MQSLSRKIRQQLIPSLHGVFALGQRFGVDILPRHFYSSIPDIRQLRRSESWKLPSVMTGVAGADIESQMSFLQGCCLPPLQDRLSQGGIYEHSCRENAAPGYSQIDSDFLYCFIATKRPRKIVQVGCGVSTAVILLAAKEVGYSPQIICIDPFPSQYLTRAAEQKRIELIAIPAQEVDLEVFTGLDAGDFLFVDSTHTVRTGSEVNRIILEVLPRLCSECFVHFHDIYFPYDYGPTVMNTLFFWEESSLLHAFLIDNKRYAIAVSFSMLHHACPERLQSQLPNYRPTPLHHGLRTTAAGFGHFPAATYLAVT